MCASNEERVRRVCGPTARHLLLRRNGAPGWIRTSTRPLLKRLPLPVGLRALGRLGRIRTDTKHGLSVLPLPLGYEPTCSGRSFAHPPKIGGQTRIRTSAIPKRFRGYNPVLSAAQPSAQTRIVKDLAEGRRLERLCPAGPWCSRPVGYQLPEPSGQELFTWIERELQTR